MVQGNPQQFLQLNHKTNSVTLLQAPREGCQDFGPKHREDNPISLYKKRLSSLVQEREGRLDGGSEIDESCDRDGCEQLKRSTSLKSSLLTLNPFRDNAARLWVR